MEDGIKEQIVKKSGFEKNESQEWFCVISAISLLFSVPSGFELNHPEAFAVLWAYFHRYPMHDPTAQEEELNAEAQGSTRPS